MIKFNYVQLIFHFPPDSWPPTLLIWAGSLFALKWVRDLYVNRNKGVTIVKPMTLRKIPFFIYPGKVSKEFLEKKFRKPTMMTYFSPGKTKSWMVLFILVWLFMFLMGVVEIVDNRNI